MDEMIISFSHLPSTVPVPKILQNLEVLVLLLGVKAKKKASTKTTAEKICIFPNSEGIFLVEFFIVTFLVLL